jgi:2-polyprenyl-3-methyl-5-hydroxy-6-metoxy-1,4-benzoquinol methylase
MAQEGLSFEDRRMAARKRADELQRQAESSGDALAWFDDLYRAASDDPAQVPWADLEPHPGLAEWIGRSGNLYEGKALDIGCGLGDNAEALSEAGYEVTAFDLSPTAVDWARQRFPNSAVSYHCADLFDLPDAWKGAFNLVHECYTIQALKSPYREQAFAAIADLIAPGGMLLVICRSRPDGVEVDGPPWPLSREELARFTGLGLSERMCQPFEIIRPDRSIPHFRVTYVKEG